MTQLNSAINDSPIANTRPRYSSQHQSCPTNQLSNKKSSFYCYLSKGSCNFSVGSKRKQLPFTSLSILISRSREQHITVGSKRYSSLLHNFLQLSARSSNKYSHRFGRGSCNFSVGSKRKQLPSTTLNILGKDRANENR